MKKSRRPFWLYLWRSVDQLLPLWDAGACRWDGLWYTLVPDNGGSARKPNRALLEIERLEKRWLMATLNSITEFPLTLNMQTVHPAALTADADGNLYTTDGSHLYEISQTDGSITAWMTITYGSVGDLAPGPSSNICFGLNGTPDPGGDIGCVPKGLGALTTILLSSTNTNFSVHGLGTGPDGKLWFTGTGAYGVTTSYDAVGFISGTSATEYLLGNGNFYDPRNITAGSDGNLWFTEANNTGVIARITPGGTVTTFPLHNAYPPIDIVSGPDGNLWFTEGSPANAAYLGRISLTGVVTEFDPVNNASIDVALAVGPDRAIWLASTDAGPPGNSYLSAWSLQGNKLQVGVGTLTPSAGIADLILGPRNKLWFTEQTAGKIGRIDWYLAGSAPSTDPHQGTGVPVGPGGGGPGTGHSPQGTTGPDSDSTDPETGDFQTEVPLDFKDSTCSCGQDDSSVWPAGQPALVYHSNTTGVAPIIQITEGSDSDPNAPVPDHIVAQLIFNSGQPVNQTYSTTGYARGTVFLMDLQAPTTITSSGYYPWTVNLTTCFNSACTLTLSSAISDSSFFLVNGASDAYGPGWSIAGVDQLIPGGIGDFWSYGAGGSRYFQWDRSPTYASPPNDFGTLTGSSSLHPFGPWKYTAKDGTVWKFKSTGQTTPGLLTSITDLHGLMVTYSYDTNNLLTQVTAPDGALTTLSYSGSLLSLITEPGNRLVTINHNGVGDLTSVTMPDGSLRTFTYDLSHRLTSDQLSPEYVTISYDPTTSLVSLVNDGGGTTWSLTSANRQALTNVLTVPSMQGPVPAVLTDGLSHPTTYSLDNLGRWTALMTPDGATQTRGLDFAGQPATTTDGLGNVTRYTYQYGNALSTASLGDLTQITNPDNSTIAYQYETAFHHATQIRDTRGDLTTMTYDAVTGDLLTTKNALGQVTTEAWSAGLLQSVKDPLGNITSYLYDMSRRLTTTIDAMNHRTTYGYDAIGNQTLAEDVLTHTTTSAYDAMRRVTSQTDANGGLTAMVYNALGELLSQTDPLGHVTQYGYDGHGWQTAVIQAPGLSIQRITTSVYDVLGRVTARTDADNHTTSFSYDAVGRVRTTTSPVGGVVTNTYDLAGNLTAVTDALNHTTTTSFDVRNRATQVQDALTNLTSTVYDTESNVLATVDARGNRTSYLYDVLNRQTQLKDAAGDITTTVYDAAGNVTATEDARGNWTTFAYDVLNRQTQVKDALLHLSTTVYDAVGNVTNTIDQLGNVTTTLYDVLNRVTTRTDPLGFTTTTAYDKDSNVLSVQDPRTYFTSYAYDALNQRTQTQDATGLYYVTVLYDPAGNATTTIDQRGHLSTMAYDAANRLTASTDQLNHTSTTVYDLADNVTTRIDALGNRTTMGYDADNRLTSLQDPGPGTGITTTVYDVAGNVTATVDPVGDRTTYSYDALNRQTQTLDANNKLTTTLYDVVGNVTTIIDADGNRTTMVYDVLNRQTQMTDALNHSGTMAYDVASRLTSQTDRNGRHSDFGYDNDNRKTSETWVTAGGTSYLTYAYDPVGNVLNGATSHSLYTLTYDVLNRRYTETEPFGLSLTYSYDPTGNRTLLQDSLGGMLTSVYDVANRLTSRQFSGTSQPSLRYDLAYNIRNDLTTVTRFSDTGGQTQVGYSVYGYDPARRLTSLQHFNTGGGALATYTYGYDLASRVTTEVINGTSRTDSYDPTSQLLGDGVTTYGYDANGNRTNKGPTALQNGTENQLTFDGTWTYSYDNEGNRTTMTQGPNADTWSFGYDNWNHMIWAKDSQHNDGTYQTWVTYTYDAFGQRIERDVWTNVGGPGTVTVYRYGYEDDAWVGLNGAGGQLERVWRGDVVDQLFARIGTGGQVGWYLTDRLGSVRDIADNTGTVRDHLDYDGFGNILTETNSAFGDVYKYTGREFDSETGLQYNRARYYDPRVGRWTTQDPAGFGTGDPNLYRYVENNPTNSVDPSGLQQTLYGQSLDRQFSTRQGAENWWRDHGIGPQEPPWKPATISEVTVESGTLKFQFRFEGYTQKQIDFITNAVSKTIYFDSIKASSDLGDLIAGRDRRGVILRQVCTWFRRGDDQLTQTEYYTIQHVFNKVVGGLTSEKVVFRNRPDLAAPFASASLFAGLPRITTYKPFWEKSSRRRVSILLHELTHVFGATADFGYLIEWRNPDSGYATPEGAAVDLHKDKLIWNADTYEAYFEDFYNKYE